MLGLVGGEDVVGEVNGAAAVEQAAAASPALAVVLEVARTAPVGDGQAGDRDGEPLADVERPEPVAAADSQQAGPRTLDVQVLTDRQLAASQRNGLAIETGGEDDGVAAFGGF